MCFDEILDVPLALPFVEAHILIPGAPCVQRISGCGRYSPQQRRSENGFGHGARRRCEDAVLAATRGSAGGRGVFRESGGGVLLSGRGTELIEQMSIARVRKNWLQ